MGTCYSTNNRIDPIIICIYSVGFKTYMRSHPIKN